MKTDQTSAHPAFHRSNWNLSRLGIELNNPRWWFEVICIAVVYFAVSWLIARTIVSTTKAPSPVWPGAGFNVGLLLVWGRSRWLGIFLGTLFLNLHRNWLEVLAPSLAASAGSTIGSLITASLILQFTRTKYPFNQVRHVVIFALCSIFSGTIFQTVVGITAYFVDVTNTNISINTSKNIAEDLLNPQCVISFSIRDTGVGIAPEELSELFVSFSQAQAGREKQEGTGLGLAISLSFVKLMGGDISVTSELGKGTTFQFQIQAELGQELMTDNIKKRRTLAVAPDQPTYRILVVDDKPVNCQLLVKLLRPMGFEVQEASNGQEAIAIWDQWEPHLIWMDMRMPVMDGYEATKQIKSTVKGSATAVIALTASVLEEEKAIVLSAGCDDFIRKPFSEQMIFDTLAKHLGVKYIYEESQSHEAEIDFFAQMSLTSDNLKIMPDSWIVQLYRSSLEADKNIVINLIGEIPDNETFLVRSLNKLAKNFQFEKLIDLTEPLISTDIK